MYHQKIGQLGEAAVVRWVRRHGGVVIARNKFFRCGELDVVAWWPAMLVFIEVKTRRNRIDAYGGLEEALSEQKLLRWERAIDSFLQGTNWQGSVQSWLALVAYKRKNGLSLRFIDIS